MLISRIEPTLTGTQPHSAAGWRRPGLSHHRPRRPVALALALAGHAVVLAALILLIRKAVLPEPPPASDQISMIFVPEPTPPTPEPPAMPLAEPPAPAALEPPSPPATEPPPLPATPPPVLEPVEPAPAPLPAVPAPAAPAPAVPPAAEVPPEPPPPRAIVRPLPPRPAIRKPQEARRPVPARPSAEEPAETARLPPSPAPPAPSASASSPPSLGPTISAAPLPGNGKPPYPLSARRMGEQGRVMISVSLSASGTPESVSVTTSSGHAVLDEAAVNAIRGWRFRPAERNGQPVASMLNVPVTFRLEDE